MTQKKDEPGNDQSLGLTGRKEIKMTRRRFLSYGIGGITAVIIGTLLYPLARYTASPAFAAGSDEWLPLGETKDFTANQPKKVDFSYQRQDGWMTVQQKSSCWVVAKEDGKFDVFNPKCTHLGCAYHWDQNESKFLCPCHGGIYDVSGKVLAGPPPRPLDRVDYKVEGGKLLVKGV